MNVVIEPFAKHMHSPKLEQAEGISIRVVSQQSSFVLHGTCRASKNTADKLSDTLLHNVAIVCICGSNLDPLVFPVVKDKLVFPDDIDKNGDFYTAFFNVNLNEHSMLGNLERLFIVASFHTFLSETLLINNRE